MGMPTDKQQYIHRIGRTARAGAAGQGLLVLSPWEAGFLNQLNDLPITDYTPRFTDAATAQPTAQLAGAIARVPQTEALAASAAQAYRAWLGFYNTGSSKVVRFDKTRLVATANSYARIIGLTQTPSIERKTVGKMGLRGVPGLLVV
jgi:ATP-dependent RNA helicase MSS116